MRSIRYGLLTKRVDTIEAAAGTPDADPAHNDLDGLNEDDYVHLTAQEYSDLMALVEPPE